MRLLLDTHVFLWFITGDRRVQRVRVLIENADQVYLNPVFAKYPASLLAI